MYNKRISWNMVSPSVPKAGPWQAVVLAFALFFIDSGISRGSSDPLPKNEANVNYSQKHDFKESDRQELDRRQRQYEEQYLSGTDLDPFATQAFQVNDPTGYFLIQKIKMFETKGAILATLKKFSEKWQKDSPGGAGIFHEEAKHWILNLCRSYPENGYLAYLHALWLYSELRETEANPVALEVIQKMDGLRIPKDTNPKFDEIKNLEDKKAAYRKLQTFAENTESIYGLPLTTFLLVNGYYREVGLAMEKMDAACKEMAGEAPSPLQSFGVLIAVLNGQQEKLFQSIEDPNSKDQDFCNACEALLSDRQVTVLAEARRRAKQNPHKPDLQINLAKCLWRTGKVEELERVIQPLLKARNLKLLEWWRGVESFKAGCPEEIDERVLVRIVLPIGTGSGFFVSSDGYVLTAAHNVAMAKNQRDNIRVVDSSGKAWPVEKINIHPCSDLAVLKIQKTGGPFVGMKEKGWEPEERVIVVGFPAGSLVPFHHRPQLLGGVEGADEVVLTGKSLSGFSGSPIFRGNAVMAVKTSTLGGMLVDPVQGMVADMRGWPSDRVDNFESLGKEGNFYFDPWLKWREVFAKKNPSNDDLGVPEELRQELSLANYLKKKQDKKNQDAMSLNRGSLALLARESSRGQDEGVWLEKQKFSPSLVAYLRKYSSLVRSGAKPEAIYQGMEELHRTYPKLPLAISYMAFYKFLQAFGKLDEYAQKRGKGFLSEENYAIIGTKVVDPGALRESISLMEIYGSLESDLSWDSLSGLGTSLAGSGIDDFLYQWAFSETKLSMMLADAEGGLNDLTVRKLADEGNPFAMAMVAQNLSKTDEKIAGFSYALRSAEAGEPAGQAVLARYFLAGIGTVKNEAKGFSWALQSAEGGHPQGCLFAGVCLVQGIGVAKDPGRGLRLIQKAALAGNEEAKQILVNPRLAEQVVF